MCRNQNTIRLSAVFFLLLLAGCAVRPHSNLLERDIEFLTSDVCGGRLSGTAGNQAASDFIASQFQEAKLSYLFEQSFLLPYTQAVFDFDASKQTITANYADGHSEVFAAGQDFYPLLIVDSFHLQGTVSTDPLDIDLTQKILVSEVRSDNPSLAQVLPSEYATARLLNPSMDEVPTIRIHPDVFHRLKEAASLTFDSNVIVKETALPNVVGVLPGTERKNALIISAHFDHVGSFGDTIYQGTLDNATGVAVLLEIARQMAAQSERPTFDIIFCALNGEEMGQQGSKAFANTALPYQTINVINLDTLGQSGSSSLAIAGDSLAFSDQIQTHLTALGIRCSLGEFGASDHLSFQAVGIPAITLSSWGEAPYTVIHTPEDKMSGIDLSFLEEISVAICDYIGTAKLLPPSHDVNSEEALLWEIAERVAAETIQAYAPARNQVVSFTLQGDRFYARDCSPIDNAEEAQTIWPALKLPSQLGSYFFRQLHFQTTQDQMVRRQIDAKDQFEPEVIPVPQQDNIHSYCLDYLDELNQGITVTVYDNRYYGYADLTALFELEEKIVDGHTLIYQYTSTETQRVLNNIAYYNAILPCSFMVTSIDGLNPMSTSTLETIVLENINALKSFYPLED